MKQTLLILLSLLLAFSLFSCRSTTTDATGAAQTPTDAAEGQTQTDTAGTDQTSAAYPATIFCFNYFSATHDNAVIDEGHIKSFVDMLNACTLRPATEEEKSDPSLTAQANSHIYQMKWNGQTFWLNEKGFYSTADMPWGDAVYRYEGFDEAVFADFLAARVYADPTF